MLKDELSLKFIGFRPSEFAQTSLNKTMSELLDEAPYGAMLKAAFTKKGLQYKGVVTIYSSAGRFFAVSTGSELKKVNHKLTEQIRKQFDKWKSQRFHLPTNNVMKGENYDSDSMA